MPRAPLLVQAARREPVERTPVWFMRQAGRILPEYRAIRERLTLIEISQRPDLAAEVTLQPLRRMPLDAAIMFADIMTPLIGAGVALDIVEGVGPVIERPIRDDAGVRAIRALQPDQDVPYVLETLRLVRRELDASQALIGFAGAPFTLAAYLVEGRPSRDFVRTKSLMYGAPATWHMLMDRLAELTVAYLRAQIGAGVDAVQLFDSWAGVLPEEQLFSWSLEPMVRIAHAVHARHPRTPIIAFPRAVGPATLMYRRSDAFAALSIDTGIGAHWAARELQPHICLQGNLDPLMLVAGGAALEREATRILDKLGHGPFVFNLGHGVVPQTPPEHVAQLVEIVRNWKPPSS